MRSHRPVLLAAALLLSLPAILARAAVLVAGQMVFLLPVGIAAQQNNPIDHAAHIKTLSEQLRVHAGQGLEHFESIKEDVSRELYAELDAYVTENFTPSSSSSQLQAGLDTVLGRKEGDDRHNIVFSVDLQAGHFLIVGIELLGAGTNSSNGYGDSVRFRAYGVSGQSLVYVACTGDLSDSALADLNAKIVPEGSVLGQFWFAAWADVPPLAPYDVVVRLYSFDGTNFHTIWAPENIIADNVPNAVDVTNAGSVIVNRMPDWKSQIIEHDQYSVTAQGVLKTAEWATQRQ